MNYIGQNLEKIRTSKNITKSQLAKLIDVSPAYITMLENGKKNTPSVSVLTKISDALNVPFSELLGYNEDDFKNKDMFRDVKISPNTVKQVYTDEIVLEFFQSYVNALICHNYGYKKELTSDQLNNLMKIANNSLLPALELIINN